jgi:hypothetical protein
VEKLKDLPDTELEPEGKLCPDMPTDFGELCGGISVGSCTAIVVALHVEDAAGH